MKQPQATSRKYIGLWVDRDLAERLYAKAKRLDRSASALIRKLLRDDLDPPTR